MTRTGYERTHGGRRALFASLAVGVGLLVLPATASAEITPLSSFGSFGGGAGQLNQPTGIAVDGAGTVLVGDKYNFRVAEFTGTGGFLRAFGWDVIDGTAPGTGLQTCTPATGCQMGTDTDGAGALSRPNSLAIDSAGNVYVTERTNNRVSEFTPQGAFIRAFGWGVATGASVLQVCTTTCQTGIEGGEAGQFDNPRAIVLDAANTLYIADERNHRVDVFTPQGTFLRAFGWDVNSSGGSGGLEVCTTATGCQLGLRGGGAGQLDGPRGIALDGLGNLVVADTNNNRVSEFTTGGSFIRAFGWDVIDGTSMGTGPQVCTMTGCQEGTSGVAAGEFNLPYGVAPEANGNLFVSDTNNNRISEFTGQGTFLRTFGWDVIEGTGSGTGFQVCSTVSGCQAGTLGGGSGQFATPEAITTDCRGALWVADQDNHRIQRLSDPGTPLPPCIPAPQALDFSFAKVKKNKHRGTATVTILVPAPGTVLAGDNRDKGLVRATASAGFKRIRRVKRTPQIAGKVKIPIKPTHRGRKKLKRRGHLKVKAKFIYTATGGLPTTKTKSIRLVLIRR